MSKTLSATVQHEIDLLMNEEAVAFFAVIAHLHPVGDDELEMQSTFTIYADDLTRDEKLKLADMVVTLGKKIREAALGR